MYIVIIHTVHLVAKVEDIKTLSGELVFRLILHKLLARGELDRFPV